MAFATAAGYTNLPNGFFVPEVYSSKVQLGFRESTFINDITTTSYFGEIQNFGDTVHVLIEPEVTVNTGWTRGSIHPLQDITDDEITLTVDQSATYGFKLLDIEKQQSHVDYASQLVDNAAYKLAKEYQQNVLAHMYANVASGNVIGTTGSPKAIGFDVNDDYTPMEAIDELVTEMLTQNVPNDQFFLVANYHFQKLLRKEDSKYIDASVMGDGVSQSKKAMGFRKAVINGIDVYFTNDAVTDTSKAVLLAGHKSATAAAATLVKNRVIEMEQEFGYRYDGLMVWGRKVIRPTAMAAMITNITV